MNFNYSWEQRKLGQVGSAKSGIGFPENQQGGKIGIPFFKVSDMNDKGNESVMSYAHNYVSEKQIKANNWKPIVELPAIFFAKVGAAVLLNRKRLCRNPFLMDNNTMAFCLKNEFWDPDFAFSLFETIDLTDLIQVGAIPSYNSKDIENIKVHLPNLIEQQKIGHMFLEINRSITLHQR